MLTSSFLSTKLIIRSHEGPDARDKRHDLLRMDKGYTIDHDVECGKLITLFSAPDYPQFQVNTSIYLSDVHAQIFAVQLPIYLW